VPVHTGRTGREELIRINCNLHLWMRGWGCAFEHPYFALTEKDGPFDIPKLPAGAEMALIAWHEGATPQWLLPERRGKREGIPLPSLKDGEVREFNFKMRKRRGSVPGAAGGLGVFRPQARQRGGTPSDVGQLAEILVVLLVTAFTLTHRRKQSLRRGIQNIPSFCASGIPTRRAYGVPSGTADMASNAVRLSASLNSLSSCG